VILLNGIVNAASYAVTTAAGSWISIFGAGLAESSRGWKDGIPQSVDPARGVTEEAGEIQGKPHERGAANLEFVSAGLSK
jgi:uncharacterized protein (TIGR03437 family)